jgi:hypothetical protein
MKKRSQRTVGITFSTFKVYILNAVKPDSWRENILKAAENRRGKPLEKRQTPVEINGKNYPGVIAASTALNVSRQCINRWIKKGKAKYV